jgi:hypothetical protein
MVKLKKKDSPLGTPIQTPTQTPERPTVGNSFEALQNESEEDEGKSVDTITADDPQVEIESEQTEELDHTELVPTQNTSDKEIPPTPVEIKLRPTSIGPIAQILPTDEERLGTSIPLFASKLANTVGKLFPEKHPISSDSNPESNKGNLKPPPAASLPQESPAISPVSPKIIVDRELAEEIFGDDAKPPARPNPYNPAARMPPNPNNRFYASLIEQEALEKSSKTLKLNSHPGTTFQSQNFPKADQQQQTYPSIPNNNIETHTDKDSDSVEKLNQSIAQQRAQLEKLQKALADLKAPPSPRVTQDMELSHIDDDEFLPVGGHDYKKKTKNPPEKPCVANESTGVPVSHPVITGRQSRDPLTELAATRPVYPPLPEPTPRRSFTQRLTWRIDIPKADTPANALIEGITEVWSALKEADDKMIVYPWKVRNFYKFKALSGPSKLQNNTKEFINRYFPDAYFRPQPGPMYLNVFIGTSISQEELGLRTQHFFGTKTNRTRVAFWKNSIPFEDVVEIGWLFRSTPGMSAEHIQKELLAHTGIHASLRWRLISIELKGKMEKDLESRALHISVRREDANLAKAKFTKLVFARHRRSHFIGGSPMRMIPLCKDVSPRNKPKCVHYAGRQQNFLKELASAEVFDILQIDIKSVGLLGKTLRDLILEIPLRDSPNRQAFLSVDRAFNKSTVKLHFYEKDESECRSRISTLLPYLVFTNPHLEKGIRGCFSADANDRAKGVKWDDKRKEVVTVDDEIFESFEDLDSDEEADNKKPRVQQFMINFEKAAGLVNKKGRIDDIGPTTKVQEVDAASLFSQSTMRSRRADQNSEESDDTPKTINRATPTAQTEALSSLSEGVSFDLKSRLEMMTTALLQLTTMIPNTPDNQAALANIRAILPQSQSAGSSSDAAESGSTGSGSLPV